MSADRPSVPTGHPLARWFPPLWAIAHLAHLWNHGEGRFTNAAAALTIVLAAALLSAPSRWWPRMLVLLALAQLADVAATVPRAPDHWHLVGAVNLAILVSAAVTTLRARAGDADAGLDGDALVVSAAPAMRVIVTIAYVAAAAAKYNESFLDPDASCAGELADVWMLGAGPSALDPLHVLTAVGSESIVGLSLLVPRLRRYGAVFGMVFHFGVSLSPAIRVADFTGTLLALFVLFLPATQLVAMETSLRDRDWWPHLVESRVSRIVRFVALVALTLVVGYGNWIVSILFLWVVFSVVGFVIVKRAVRTVRVPGDRPTGRLHPGHLLAVAAVLLIALSPYLGARTTGAFTMFSNLRTEGPGSNHLFMPSLHLVDWQNDLALVTGGSDEPWVERADEGLWIPEVQIRSDVHRLDDLVVDAEIDGEPRTLGPDGADAEKPPWYMRRLMNFRAVALDGPQVCSN